MTEDETEDLRRCLVYSSGSKPYPTYIRSCTQSWRWRCDCYSPLAGADVRVALSRSRLDMRGSHIGDRKPNRRPQARHSQLERPCCCIYRDGHSRSKRIWNTGSVSHFGNKMTAEVYCNCLSQVHPHLRLSRSGRYTSDAFSSRLGGHLGSGG